MEVTCNVVQSPLYPMLLTFLCNNLEVSFHAVVVFGHQPPCLEWDNPLLKFPNCHSSGYMYQDNLMVSNPFVKEKLHQRHDGQFWCVVDTSNWLPVAVDKGTWL